MKTNLIQNFIQNQNTQQAQPAQKPKKKEAPHFDIHHELANRTFIKPLKGHGRLINGNLLDAPVTMAKSLAYDTKALFNGIDGEANDHQLGKLNDIGMKLGGLTIAGYLFTKKQTPLTKAMEFVGLGSFFASMAIWPKLAIQLPARLIHGFNVQQQYEDSFGRKKPFYQDPQFLPWDLYSDDEINKIGDRMGVPKDLPNRREFIQEKMKKIAIQNNTLWMLTAGFATPVMSALICNALEKPLSKPLSNMRSSSNDNILANFNKIVKENNYQKITEEIEKAISIDRNKPLTKEMVTEYAYVMCKGFPAETAEALADDLCDVIKIENNLIGNTTAKTIYENAKKALKAVEIPNKIIDSVIMKPEELIQYFEEKGFYGNDYNVDDIDRIYSEYVIDMRSRIDNYNSANPDNKISKKAFNKIIDIIVRAPEEDNPILKGLKVEHGAILNPKNEAIIKGVAQTMNDLRGNLNVVNKYLLHQLGTAPETTIADYWNNTVDKLVKALKITPKEIENTRGDRLLVTDLLQKRFDDIATDKNAYKAVMTAMIEQMTELTKTIKQSNVNETTLNSKEETKFNKQLDAIFKSFEENLKKVAGLKDGDMEGILSEMLGSRKNQEVPRSANGGYNDLFKKIASDRLLEVKASFFRILNTLDLHRRIAVGDPKYYTALHGEMLREAKEDVVELSKLIGISGHTSDYLTKFFKQRNPQMEQKDKSNIVVENGRMVRKYTAQNRPGGIVDLPQAKELFVESMKLQYENPLLDETVALFGSKHKELFKEFETYRRTVLNEIGNANAIEKELHKVSDAGSSASSAKIFKLTGAATDEIIANFGQQAFNTRKWLKIFGTTGAVLLGVTVLSQFFFGKMKLPQTPQESKKG